MIKLGITGGIGSGKSIVSELLQIKGIPCYNADMRSKMLLNTNPQIQSQLKKLLGQDIYKDGKLDRTLMASLIFTDKQLLSEINSMIHPVVFEDFLQWSNSQKTQLVASETAILFESGFDKFVDLILVVSAPLELRISRAMKRDNISRNAVCDRIKNQLPETEKEKKADFILINDDKSAVIPQLNYILDNIM
jgi:dephospho-CoA kinase